MLSAESRHASDSACMRLYFCWNFWALWLICHRNKAFSLHTVIRPNIQYDHAELRVTGCDHFVKHSWSVFRLRSGSWIYPWFLRSPCPEIRNSILFPVTSVSCMPKPNVGFASCVNSNVVLWKLKSLKILTASTSCPQQSWFQKAVIRIHELIFNWIATQFDCEMWSAVNADRGTTA